jgi:hypothetical protein
MAKREVTYELGVREAGRKQTHDGLERYLRLTNCMFGRTVGTSPVEVELTDHGSSRHEIPLPPTEGVVTVTLSWDSPEGGET